MRIDDFLWLDTIVEKMEWKHTVFPDEVIEVFAGDPYIRFVEKGLVGVKMSMPPRDRPTVGGILSCSLSTNLTDAL